MNKKGRRVEAKDLKLIKKGMKLKQIEDRSLGDSEIVTVDKVDGNSIKHFHKGITTSTGCNYSSFEFIGDLLKRPNNPTHVVIWEEDTDPAEFVYSEKEAKAKALELLENPSVKKDSIYIVEIKSIKKPTRKVSFKEVKKLEE